MSDEQKFVHKVHGWRHLLAAQGYSLNGFRRLLRETAFRHELTAFGLSLLLFMLIGASVGNYLALLVLFLVVCAVEALNTAIEEIIDRISPELSITGRHAKDLGSLAVFCMLCAWALLVAYVVCQQIIAGGLWF